MNVTETLFKFAIDIPQNCKPVLLPMVTVKTDARSQMMKRSLANEIHNIFLYIYTSTKYTKKICLKRENEKVQKCRKMKM